MHHQWEHYWCHSLCRKENRGLSIGPFFCFWDVDSAPHHILVPRNGLAMILQKAGSQVSFPVSGFGSMTYMTSVLLIFYAKKPHYWSCPIICSIRPWVRVVVSVACVSTCHTHMTSLMLVIDNIWLGFCNQYWLSMSPFDKKCTPQ